MKIGNTITQNFGRITASKKMERQIRLEYANAKLPRELCDYWEYKFAQADRSRKYDIFIDDNGTAIVTSKKKPYKQVSTHYLNTPLESLGSAIKSITI